MWISKIKHFRALTKKVACRQREFTRVQSLQCKYGFICITNIRTDLLIRSRKQERISHTFKKICYEVIVVMIKSRMMMHFRHLRTKMFPSLFLFALLNLNLDLVKYEARAECLAKVQFRIHLNGPKLLYH